MRVGLPLLLAALAAGALPAAAGDGGEVALPEGTLVVVHRSEDRLTSIDLHTGFSRTVRAPWLARCATAPQVIGGRLVVAGQRGGHGVVVTLTPGLRDRRVLAPSWLSVPSATPGRVWVVDEPPPRFSTLPGVREVTVDGRVTVRSRRDLPAAYVAGAVAEGLVFERRGHLAVWDPAAGREKRRLPGLFVVGTHGSLVASCGPGECRRGLQIADARSGRRVVVRPPHSARLEPTGAFSPSGRHVAVTATAKGRRLVALIDVASGRASLVRGSRLHPWYPSLTWSPSGDWVFWNAGRGAVMAYRLGSAAAVRLPFRIPRAMSMAVG
jgi:hypothetical protein